MIDNYKTITVKDVVNFINAHPNKFPRGLNTPISSGDFEGNGYHNKHELMVDGGKIFFGYEQHEWLG